MRKKANRCFYPNYHKRESCLEKTLCPVPKRRRTKNHSKLDLLIVGFSLARHLFFFSGNAYHPSPSRATSKDNQEVCHERDLSDICVRRRITKLRKRSSILAICLQEDALAWFDLINPRELDLAAGILGEYRSARIPRRWTRWRKGMAVLFFFFSFFFLTKKIDFSMQIIFFLTFLKGLSIFYVLSFRWSLKFYKR